MYEVYHWEETTQYNPQTGEGGLFAPYVNRFLRIKQMSSGWPEWCKTDEDKERYIVNYKAREGIELDRNLIKKNPGLRSLSKLSVNR